MAKANTFFRKKTADFPLAVYYFSPTHIDEKPRPLHRSQSLILMWMEEGQVEFFTTAGMTVVTAGDICIVPPGSLHAFHTVTLDTRYLFLSIHPGLFAFPSSHFFTREFMQPLENGTLKMPSLLRPGEEGYSRILCQMQRLDPQKEGSNAYTMELLGIATDICAALYPLCRRGPELHAGQSAGEQCLHYLQSHFHQKITLEELAEHVHLHPNYLCSLFREQTGKTIFDQLNWERIHEASKLLRSTDLPISQIAIRCGFQDPNFFARKFRQYLGSSPTAYRKKNRSGEKNTP